MTNLLLEYVKARELKEEAFKKALIVHGPVDIGPTNKGGIFMKYNDKEIANTLTVDDLHQIRKAITLFLTYVIGEHLD